MFAVSIAEFYFSMLACIVATACMSRSILGSAAGVFMATTATSRMGATMGGVGSARAC